jgi:hypothetical protein
MVEGIYLTFLVLFPFSPLGPVLGRCSAAGYANEPAAPFATINETHHCDSFLPCTSGPGPVVIYVVDETGFALSRAGLFE